MRLGQPADVSDGDLHATHLMEHAPDIQEILAGIESGQIDQQAVMEAHQLLHEHAAAHTEYLSGDPSATSEAGAYRELIANSEAVLMNGYRAQQKIERESAGQQAEEGRVDPKLREQELKLEEIRLRIELKQREFDTKQKLAEQKLLLTDIVARNGMMKGVK